MLNTRPLSVVDTVTEFLAGYEITLIERGYSRSFVESIAKQLFDIIFYKITSVQLNVTYIGVFRDIDGYYSRYHFSDGDLYGEYISNGEHVILLSIGIHEQIRLPNISAA